MEPVERNLAVSRFNKLIEWILRLPILWGGVVGLAFYAALDQGWINSPLLVRYMAGHPVEYTTGIAFFVGSGRAGDAVSRIKPANLRRSAASRLAPAPLGGMPVSACDELACRARRAACSTTEKLPGPPLARSARNGPPQGLGRFDRTASAPFGRT